MKVPLKLFNSLNKRIEVFKPIKKKQVSVYACGPTVYQAAHIGNLRTYLFEDLLRRVLEYNGYEVKHIMNITDVGHLTSDADIGEDKVETAARKAQKTASEITKHYADLFKKDLKTLNIEFPQKFAWASKYIKEQIELIKKIEKKGYTYITDDGIYFDTTKFKKYGRLGKVSVGKSRVKHSQGKKSISDFALWKFSKPDEKRQQEWKSPWGIGYPGWHIECSAISTKELGQPFDIHLGGEDHIAIHHNNEIAQSEAANNKPLANYWLHGAFMLLKDKKMSKSKGNFIVLDDLSIQSVYPLAFRYLAITSHYRSKLNFSKEALINANNSLEGLRSFFILNISRGKILKKYIDKFIKAINNDLNTPEAMKVVWELVKSKEKPKDKRATLLDMDKVLGLGLDKLKPIPIVNNKKLSSLLQQRDKARENKDWEKADNLRSQIEELGYEIVDGKRKSKLIPKV